MKRKLPKFLFALSACLTFAFGLTACGAFCYCDSLTSVYYKGTAEDWSGISIGSENPPLTNATRYY